MESLRGMLLVASPRIFDPHFRRAVVLLAEHSDDGALGLVLNRRAGALVGDVASAAGELAWLGCDPGDEIWDGGPVGGDGLIVLAQLDDPSLAAVAIGDGLGLVPAETEDPEALAASVQRARVFAGHAGWGAGQLEAELEEDSWILEPVRAGDAFDAEPDALWADVLRRKGDAFALLATMPDDPSRN